MLYRNMLKTQCVAVILSVFVPIFVIMAIIFYKDYLMVQMLNNVIMHNI